ncbi:hypothetical protein ABHI18_010808 [Aspergillus niger]
MGYPKLYVVHYRRRYGNFLTLGPRNIVNARPESFGSYTSKMFIVVLGKDGVQDVKIASKSLVVNNETVGWGRQDYVLEMLDKLEDKFVLDGDDEDYHDARNNLGFWRNRVW